jgi:hypothetical protein
VCSGGGAQVRGGHDHQHALRHGRSATQQSLATLPACLEPFAPTGLCLCVYSSTSRPTSCVHCRVCLCRADVDAMFGTPTRGGGATMDEDSPLVPTQVPTHTPTTAPKGRWSAIPPVQCIDPSIHLHTHTHTHTHTRRPSHRSPPRPPSLPPAARASPYSPMTPQQR